MKNHMMDIKKTYFKVKMKRKYLGDNEFVDTTCFLRFYYFRYMLHRTLLSMHSKIK